MKSRILLFLCLFCAMAGAQQYIPALPGYQYQFPRDHFNHPAYQTEWWYYTGNLRAQDGHRFGFELTFFRQGVSRQPDPSPWFVHDLYMAHLALSDISSGRYYKAERLNRAGPGIAGIDASKAIVWNGSWRTQIGEKLHTLRGYGDDFSLELNAAPEKPLVIQGENGISQKAAGKGHASHYVSYTRMQTSGTVEIRKTKYKVDGDTWMDHEFFTEPGSGDEVGWDWLSLQLTDRTELMLYRLRHKDGSVDPYSSGTYVDALGKPTHLTSKDFSMVPAGLTWKSPDSGADYPLSWSVQVPSLHLDLAISTPLRSQEFLSRVGPSYWEGAIDVSGHRDHQSQGGSGYLEMTGYSHGKSPLLSASPR